MLAAAAAVVVVLGQAPLDDDSSSLKFNIAGEAPIDEEESALMRRPLDGGSTLSVCVDETGGPKGTCGSTPPLAIRFCLCW